MLLIIRLALFVLGFLFRFAPNFGKPEPRTTGKGNKYGYFHHKSKNGTVTETEIWIPVAQGLRFRLRDETSWTHFCATIGFGSEFKVGATPDHEFDRRFYVASDQPVFLSGLKVDLELQRTFSRLRDLGFHSFASDGSGHLKLKMTGHFVRFETLESDLDYLAEKLNLASSVPHGIDTHFVKLMLFEAVLYGLVGYAFGGYITMIWDSGLVHLDSWQVAMVGILFGVLFIFVWLILIFVLMRRSAYAPLLVTDFVFFGFLIVVSAGPMFASDLNRQLDTSPTTTYRAGIYNVYSRTTGSGKHRRTRHYLSLKYLANPLGLPTELQVTDRYRFSPNQGLEVEIREGYLGMKYIARLNSTTFPAELSPAGSLSEVSAVEKRLIVTEAIQQNLAWREKVGERPRLPNSEVVEQKYRDGQLKSQELHVGGKRQGISTYYHPNGRLYAAIVWINDARHGSFKVFRDDGSLEQWTSYKDGKPHGMFAWFSANGTKEQPSHLAIYKDGEVIDGNRDGLLPLYQELMLPQFASF